MVQRVREFSGNIITVSQESCFVDNSTSIIEAFIEYNWYIFRAVPQKMCMAKFSCCA